MAGRSLSTSPPMAARQEPGWNGRWRLAAATARGHGTCRAIGRRLYRVRGKPRLISDVAGSGQREVTTLPRV